MRNAVCSMQAVGWGGGEKAEGEDDVAGGEASVRRAERVRSTSSEHEHEGECEYECEHEHWHWH